MNEFYQSRLQERKKDALARLENAENLLPDTQYQMLQKMAENTTNEAVEKFCAIILETLPKKS